MDRIEDNLDVIDQNNKKSKYLIKGMTSTWGYLKNLFSKTPVTNVHVPARTPETQPQDDWEIVNRPEPREQDQTKGFAPKEPGLRKQDDQIDQLISQVKSI